MKLRSKKQRTSPNTTRAVAGDVASTSASASKKRRRRDEKKTTTTTDQDENEDVQIKKQQQKKRRGLPDELWDKILESVDDNSVMAFASVSKQLRRVQRRSGRKLVTNMLGERGGGGLVPISSFKRGLNFFKYAESSTLSEDWCLWNMSFLSAGIQQEQSKHIMNAAAFSGHLGALQYWKERNRAKKSLFDEQTCAFAALGGQMEVLVWLRENSRPWNEYTCQCAALEGHLDVLKYAHEHRCPWNQLTCKQAALGGHLEVLKY